MMQTAERRRKSRVWRWILVAHAAVVVGLLSIFLVSQALTPPEEGVSIGGAILALPLQVPLGLPWSVPVVADPNRFNNLPILLLLGVYFGPALINVALHAALFFAVQRIRHRRK